MVQGASTVIDRTDLTAYPLRTRQQLRYADTDRQGHVNNAVFAVLLESGRVEVLYNEARPLADKNCAFVIARMEIDFRAELRWPGEVEIATAVGRVGSSSLELSQALFQNNECAAVAKSVIVQMNETTRRSHPLTDSTRDLLATWLVQDGG
jgi:acyl-CoA thioester hydrolase